MKFFVFFAALFGAQWILPAGLYPISSSYAAVESATEGSEPHGDGAAAALHFLEQFKRARGENKILANQISKSEFLKFLKGWPSLPKSQKKRAFKIIKTSEGYNLLHLTARISPSPSSKRIYDQMRNVLIDADELLGIQKFFDLLTQRDLEHQKPFDLAAVESFKQQLADHEAVARRRMKERALSNFQMGGVFGFATLVAASADLNISIAVLGGNAIYFCYNAFKKTLSLTEK